MPKNDPGAYSDPDSPHYDPSKAPRASAQQGDDFIQVLESAKGAPLEPAEVEAFAQSDEGNYALTMYNEDGAVTDENQNYIMEAFDTWRKRQQTVPDDLMTQQQ